LLLKRQGKRANKIMGQGHEESGQIVRVRRGHGSQLHQSCLQDKGDKIRSFQV
jgi:hypothetical protein